MIAVADNLNTRNTRYMEALAKRDRETIAGLAQKIRNAGADIINVQCSLDGAGDETTLPWITGVISNETDTRLSLDSRNVDALKASLPICRKPPLINFLSRSAGPRSTTTTTPWGRDWAVVSPWARCM